MCEACTVVTTIVDENFGDHEASPQHCTHQSDWVRE
jgi:hypothetical protein